jgi:hypothetical protein
VLIGTHGLPAYNAGDESTSITLYRFASSLGTFSLYFFFLLAVSIIKKKKVKKYGLMFLIPIVIICFMLWYFYPVTEGVIGGTLEFTYTSMYKKPFGFPIIELIIAIFSIIIVSVTYTFLYAAKIAKDKVVKVKSSLMAIGVFLSTLSYTIEITDAISYVYMPIYRPLIFVGLVIMFVVYIIPKSWMKVFY